MPHPPVMEKALRVKKVLLVDPDTRTRSWLVIRLESMDIQVVEAMSAAEALRVLETTDVPLVVTDWPLEGGPPAKAFFQKLNQEKRTFILFSQAPREEEGKWFVPRQNREQLLEEVAGFFGQAAGPTTLPGHGRQILIIEDSPTLRGMLRRTLAQGFPQHTVREAEDGKQAFSQMAQRKVDLIITDLEMPGMDGHTFLNLLKTNPVLSKKPVLVFSANITPELEEKAREMAHVRLLSKPADPQKIIAEVSHLLGESKSAEVVGP